ncbi:acetyltransferase [Legionella beliardensis]|uniref:Acetyltransferase n=1 Tax=Legionella beliardensis TaxID=91822 RepID=A0A378I417_9GAMM|nr:acyltransferase [Legionella beliardensis]STX29947.1 acetyltransferase [Legionella beliardensis]
MPKNINVLTSLRFFAALAVIFEHTRHFFTFTDPLKTDIPMAISVTFFFVLSGFILTYVYQDIEKSGKKFDFYAARIARAWPLHIATLLLAFFLLPLDKTLFHQPHYIATTLLNASLLHAWVPYSTVFFSYNSVSWAMSVELFFYIIFPFLGANWSRKWLLKSSLMLLFLILYLCFMTYVYIHNRNIDLTGITSVIPFSRLGEFVGGMIAAQIFINLNKKHISGGIILWSIIELITVIIAYYYAANIVNFSAWVAKHTISEVLVMYTVTSGTAPMFMALMMVFAFQKGIITKILSKDLFVFLGELSFALYLTHNILILFLVEHKANLALFSDPILFLFYSIALFLVSYVLWEYVQKPTRKIIYVYLQTRVKENLTALFKKRYKNIPEPNF